MSGITDGDLPFFFNGSRDNQRGFRIKFSFISGYLTCPENQLVFFALSLRIISNKMENLINYKSPEAKVQIRQKIVNGENVYLKNSISGVVIRISGYNDFNWAKSRDEREHRILYSSDLFDETIEEANEISKAEYENY
jgi:hypothetical protein